MSGEFARPSWPMAAIRRLRRIGLRGMLIFVILVALVTGRDPEKLGDSFQIALPVLALGCAVADGSALRLVGRFVLLEVFVRTPKLTLGMHPINLRPNGQDQGFPSRHTAAAVFGTTALVQSCLKNAPSAQAVAIMAGGFVGASRIEAGKHTIWQVLAGALVGWLAQVLALGAFDRLVARVWQRMRRGFARATRRGGSGAAGVAILVAMLAALPSGVQAQVAFDLYTGYQTAPHSRVTGSDPTGVGDFNFLAGWDGNSFAMPPHYGLRAIFWRNHRFGYFADFNHTKLYADSETLGISGTSGGFEVLEFTDGLNNLTFGPIWRWPDAWGGRAVTYIAVGLGAALPNVEVRSGPGAPTTFEYQFGGPGVSLAVGAAWSLSDRLDLITEYKGTYSQLDVDLVGGGTLASNVITNALNIGLRWHLSR